MLGRMWVRAWAIRSVEGSARMLGRMLAGWPEHKRRPAAAPPSGEWRKARSKQRKQRKHVVVIPQAKKH